MHRNHRIATLCDGGVSPDEVLTPDQPSAIDQHCGTTWPQSEDHSQDPSLQHGVGPIADEPEENPWAPPACECVVVAGEVCRCRGVKKDSND